MLPVYFISSELTVEEMKIAEQSWAMLSSTSCPTYFEAKEHAIAAGLPYPPTSSLWFAETFYDRLFDVHPVYDPYGYLVVATIIIYHHLVLFLLHVSAKTISCRNRCSRIRRAS